MQLLGFVHTTYISRYFAHILSQLTRQCHSHLYVFSVEENEREREREREGFWMLAVFYSDQQYQCLTIRLQMDYKFNFFDYFFSFKYQGGILSPFIVYTSVFVPELLPGAGLCLYVKCFSLLCSPSRCLALPVM